MAGKNNDFAVLDLALARTVNGADHWRRPAFLPRRGGAIAQLGERVVRNDEVGGSIPPGSTTLRRRRSVPRRSLGEGGPRQAPQSHSSATRTAWCICPTPPPAPSPPAPAPAIRR